MADDAERAYYQAVEDLFGALRGMPHILSPKDMHLLRTWWREGVPLVAVTVGLTEVFQHRRDRGDDEPVLTLSYCRHAVHRHAQHLAEMHTGLEPSAEHAPTSTGEAAANSLADALSRAAHDLPDRFQAAAAPLHTVAAQLRSAAALPPAAFEEHLFTLEAALLEGCWACLPETERDRLAEHAASDAESSGATGPALRQTTRAMRDRLLRRLLDLPRLEAP